MGTYCVSCKKYTANENSSVRKTNQINDFIKFCYLWQEIIFNFY